MNIIIKLNGEDVTASCLLADTRISYDSTKRITSANLTIMGSALGAAAARYDHAQYDVDTYSVGMLELMDVQILDGRDGVTKLFDGNIYAMTMKQTDTAELPLFYLCELNDFAAFLDRAVCWDSSFPLPLPVSDASLIRALVGHFCPRITLGDIAEIVPVIQQYDWLTKTCRQVLDDMATLSTGSWLVDFDGVLHYFLASAAPPAPFGLSTTPDYVSTFPVRVDGYKQDFSNPINHMFVRGTQDPQTGFAITVDYADPVSIQTYGEYASGLVDKSIVTGWDAALRAKSVVLQYAYPIETGNFTMWGPDGLKCGMAVHIHEDWIGMDGEYTIRQLTMQWTDQELVQYTAQFGAMQPDLETVLRLLNQRTMWDTSVVPVGSGSSIPAPGSVNDSSIAPGGLSASVINSVNANTIQGIIQSGQIGSVNAVTIIGGLNANQITSVNAGSVVGSLSAGQIGSVNAATIQGAITSGQGVTIDGSTITGVILSSQIAGQLIDSLSRYVDVLRPVPLIQTPAQLPVLPNPNFPPNTFFYYAVDGNFYQISANGLSWSLNNSPENSLMSFYYIGAIKATSIIGVIAAAQIGSITAGQITGLIQSNQIGSVDASVIVGNLNLSGLGIVVNASAIQGQIQASQIANINANQIYGTIAATQIQSINAGQITGTLAYTQIGSVAASTINIGQIQSSQIGSVAGQTINVGSIPNSAFNGYSIDVGGLNNLPGRIRVMDPGSAVRAQLGILTEVGIGAYGGWFQLFGAGGSYYGDAPIFTDAGGNLTIRAANMAGSTLTGATLNGASLNGASLTNPTVNINGQITTGPQIFDATYGSLSMQNTDGTDTTSFISRGLVIYSSGQKVGALVRSPFGAYMALEFTVGGAYVLIDGLYGVRSDQGYLVGATRVINNLGQFTGTLVGSFAGTINTSGSITTSSTCQASSGYYGGTFMGSGVSTGGTVQCGALNCSTASVSSGLTVSYVNVVGSGGAPLTVANGMVTAQAFGIYGVANGASMDVNISGTTLHFRGGIFTGIN